MLSSVLTLTKDYLRRPKLKNLAVDSALLIKVVSHEASSSEKFFGLGYRIVRRSSRCLSTLFRVKGSSNSLAYLLCSLPTHLLSPTLHYVYYLIYHASLGLSIERTPFESSQPRIQLSSTCPLRQSCSRQSQSYLTQRTFHFLSSLAELIGN